MALLRWHRESPPLWRATLGACVKVGIHVGFGEVYVKRVEAVQISHTFTFFQGGSWVGLADHGLTAETSRSQ
jgi:hypothetical protein